MSFAVFPEEVDDDLQTLFANAGVGVDEFETEERVVSKSSGGCRAFELDHDASVGVFEELLVEKKGNLIFEEVVVELEVHLFGRKAMLLLEPLDYVGGQKPNVVVLAFRNHYFVQLEQLFVKNVLIFVKKALELLLQQNLNVEAENRRDRQEVLLRYSVSPPNLDDEEDLVIKVILLVGASVEQGFDVVRDLYEVQVGVDTEEFCVEFEEVHPRVQLLLTHFENLANSVLNPLIHRKLLLYFS